MAAWLSVGLDIEQFWRLTISDVARVLRGKQRQIDDDFERQRVLNFELASLISFAHHDPKKLPKYKPVTQTNKKDPVEDEARVRAYFIGLSERAD